MWKKLNKYMQQKIQANYNKFSSKGEKTLYEDAAFLTFLDVTYNVAVFVFAVFGLTSFYFFFTHELLPLLK